MRGPFRPAQATALLMVALVAPVTMACGTGPDESPAAEEAPILGACRMLTPDDVVQPSNGSEVVDCAAEHTAETYAVGRLPDQFGDVAWDSADLGTYAYRSCARRFMTFLGADESLVMRTVLSWAWFLPSAESWSNGARWYRCDVVGGGDQSGSYLLLPETVRDALLGRPPDRWLACAAGESVNDSPKVPCSEPHDWRAVTTMEVGEAQDPYPGERLVRARTHDFCSDSVGAWLGDPVSYDFGYTWFSEAEWTAGNRRSVCWAKTAS